MAHRMDKEYKLYLHELFLTNQIIYYLDYV